MATGAVEVPDDLQKLLSAMEDEGGRGQILHWLSKTTVSYANA